MFVHISPEADAVSETISTLKFAERVATVELGAAKVNKDSPDVKELKEQVQFCATYNNKSSISSGFCFSLHLKSDICGLKCDQIASLKSALARKDGEADHNNSFSGSSEKYRTKASEVSPYQSKLQSPDPLSSVVANMEVKKKLDYIIKTLCLAIYKQQFPILYFVEFDA